MTDWLPIRYVDFYDVPRLFAVESEPVLLFDSPFDEEEDEYVDSYRVSRLSALPNAEELVAVVGAGEPLGEVAVGDVRFDETSRGAVHRAVIERFLPDSPA